MDAQPQSPHRPARDSLATRLILFTFLSAFITALVMSAIAVQATYSSLRARIDRSYPATLDRGSERLTQLVDATASELQTLASDPGLRRALAGETMGAGLHLQQSLLLSDRLDALVLTDSKSATLAAAYKPTLGSGVLESTLAEITAPVALAAGGIAVSVLVHDDNGQAIALLRGVIASTAISQELASYRGTGMGSVYLVDSAGRVVVDAPGAWSAFRFPNEVLSRELGSGVAEYRSADGSHALAEHRPLAFLNGGLVIAQPMEEAFAPVFSLLSRIFIADLLIVLVFSLLAVRITRTIVRPIEALAEGARRITRGEMDVALPEVGGRDEVGVLTNAFNQMATRLRDNRDEISTQHDQLLVQNQTLQDTNEVLEQLSITDGLTKLHNHRYFQEALTREIKRVSRTEEPLSIILIDIDDFKRLNDQHGHAAGDEVLIRIAHILNESVRESDILARYGGEEFVVLATGTDLEGAFALAEKIRTAVSETSFVLHDNLSVVRTTISIGVADYQGDRRAFFQAADQALYSAKGAGKDCVVAAGSESPVL